jgi:hypothetical protein
VDDAETSLIDRSCYILQVIVLDSSHFGTRKSFFKECSCTPWNQLYLIVLKMALNQKVRKLRIFNKNDDMELVPFIYLEVQGI